MNSYYDYIVVGAGIVGLTIARALSARNQNIKILIIEKESDIGCHASGRNSGVLHSGIYYQKDTLKSQVCSSGAHSMEQYCHNNDLPIKKMGKVIVPTKDQDDATLDNLVRNAEDSNLIFELIDDRRLYELEPYAKSVSGRAVYMPNVSIVEPNSVLKQILKDLKKLGVTLNFNEKLISANIDKSEITTNKSCINFGFLINAGGQYADQIAHLFHVGKQFTILPFKGEYYKLRDGANVFSNGLIYPVPCLNRPFLGVHTVKDIYGNTYFGPTATPVFGRENYRGVEGINIYEATRTIYYLVDMYMRNNQGFREYAYHEAHNYLKKNFVRSAQSIVSGLNSNDLLNSNKSGIRPQLFDKNKKELVMDLLVEESKNTLHILNAISPAFTSSFSFAEMIVDNALK